MAEEVTVFCWGLLAVLAFAVAVYAPIVFRNVHEVVHREAPDPLGAEPARKGGCSLVRARARSDRAQVEKQEPARAARALSIRFLHLNFTSARAMDRSFEAFVKGQ